ncbi:IS1096 element passenger TnpR family protein [Variovorax gracilis]|uniref:IS1096 element passenger TnpR family protein n=1 Tax=Variovorax gracilis TaxID=3053502 RepID=UPI00336BF67F
MVRDDKSVARLHQILQVAFGWQDKHLHRFESRCRQYGVHQEGRHPLRHRRIRSPSRPTEAAAPRTIIRPTR